MGSSKNGKYMFGAVALIALLVVGFLATDGFKSAPAASTAATTSTFGSTPPPTGTGLTAGDQLTVTFNHRDAITEDARTEGTNVKSTLLNKNGLGGYTILTTGSGQTYTLTANDGGKVWVGWETQASGQSYIFAKDKTMAANPGIVTECTYIDVELDGFSEFVCGISTDGLRNQQQLSGTKPDRTINVKWYEEHAPTVTGIAGTDPADQSSVGTSQTTKTILWGLDGTNGDATFIREVELKVNSTDTTEWDDSRSTLNINGEIIKLSSMSFSQDGTNTYFRMEFGKNMSTAKILEIPAIGNDKLPVTADLVVDLDSSQTHTWTLKVTFINEVDGTATDSDAVNLVA